MVPAEIVSKFNGIPSHYPLGCILHDIRRETDSKSSIFCSIPRPSISKLTRAKDKESLLKSINKTRAHLEELAYLDGLIATKVNLRELHTAIDSLNRIIPQIKWSTTHDFESWHELHRKSLITQLITLWLEITGDTRYAPSVQGYPEIKSPSHEFVNDCLSFMHTTTDGLLLTTNRLPPAISWAAFRKIFETKHKNNL